MKASIASTVSTQDAADLSDSPRQVRGACPYCGVGCGIVMHVKQERIVRITGDAAHPTNRGRLCTKGQTAHQAIGDSGRLAQAYVRHARNADPAPMPMPRAIAETARRLRAIVDRDGPGAVAFYLSGQMSIEAQYLATKLAKGFIRTPHVEANSRLCMASAASGYKQSLGADGPPGSYDDIDHADVFLVTGANMADCHPILFLRMMDRVKAGAKLIVVDPRRTSTADKASLYLRIRPGTDLALLNGLLHLLRQNGQTDPAFIAAHTEGWDAMSALLDDYTPRHVSQVTGIAEADLRTAAQWIGEAGEWSSFWTMGLNQSTHGADHTTALCNLHLATGKICRRGSGPFSLTGQPNAMGGREMGYMGPGLPGQRVLQDPRDRAFVEDLWGLPPDSLKALPSSSLPPAGGTIDLFERMATGEIKAIWIICTNPVASVPNRQTVIDGLRRAECVITQDAFMDTETNHYADVLLPGALWAEGEGVMINSERTLTLTPQAVPAPGDAQADWRIIAAVARAMGYGDAFDYADAAAVFEEIRRSTNPDTGYDLRGASHARLEDGPLQWPCPPTAEQGRNPIRYLNDGLSQALRVGEDGMRPALVFPTPNGKARFHARSYRAPAEHLDSVYGVVLNTGRVQHQWHTMTKTGKIATLNKLNGAPFVEVHPDDALAAGIVNDDPVEIRSRRGRAVLPAIVTDRVAPGECFAPIHWNDVFGDALCINTVTQDAVDPVSLQPEMKYSAVTLTRMDKPEPARVETPAVAATTAAASSSWEKILVEGMALADMHAPKPGVTALAAACGLTSVLAASPPPALNEIEQRYLAGFLHGLDARRALSEARQAASGAVAREGGTPPPTLPSNAPFDPLHRAWIDGMLAGGLDTWMRGAEGASAAIAAPPSGGVSNVSGAKPRPKVTLLWASQTGTVEGLVEPFAMRLMGAGCEIRTACMSDVVPSAFAATATGAAAIHAAQGEAGRYLLLMSSTFGDGEAPDNGRAFWDGLTEMPSDSFAQTGFAVLAFGDRHYDQFCGHGARLDARFDALGGRRLHARVECESDDLTLADQWLDQVIVAIKRDHAGSGANASAATANTMAGTTPMPGAMTSANGNVNALPTAPIATRATNDAAPGQARGGSAAASVGIASAVPSKMRPARVSVIANIRLNGEGATKDTRRIALSIKGTGLQYEAGDALGIWPTNCPALVDEILALTGADPDAMVPLTGPSPMFGHDMPTAVRLADGLLHYFEIGRPHAALLERIAEHTSEPGRGALRSLLAPDRKTELQAWLWGRQLADVLDAFPVRLDALALATVLKRLQPRLYSIASSPLTHPDEIHLTVGTVRYLSQPNGMRPVRDEQVIFDGGGHLHATAFTQARRADGADRDATDNAEEAMHRRAGGIEGVSSGVRWRKGVSSTFLADRAADAVVPVFVQSSPHFRAPRDATTPMIMVGPGTGIAPFRGFLQERQARGHTGRNWLFFGERNADTDYYYRDELLGWQRDGLLTRLDTAFSRDQSHKCYVQDRLREQGAQLWSWLRDGAVFYVCGDASRMAKDVDMALRDVVARHGGMDEAQASAYLRDMMRDKRYLRDVY
ncbi:molybdopterin-dependent oxidoreductase [Robbsia sp. KACC 23696]|uniref:molybdopterin-dependent oxidoreductase n=1 Tax=Robbsia sp. KACC 23696 TaxID=3149231 RepID=UPI00325AD94C